MLSRFLRLYNVGIVYLELACNSEDVRFRWRIEDKEIQEKGGDCWEAFLFH